MSDSRPWVARFRNGPCEPGPDRIWVVGEPWRVIKLAPVSGAGREAPRADWVIVGGDGIGEDPDAEPWPGEVTYRLIEIGSGEIGDGADREAARVGWYGLVDPTPRPERPRDEGPRYWGD